MPLELSSGNFSEANELLPNILLGTQVESELNELEGNPLGMAQGNHAANRSALKGRGINSLLSAKWA